MISDIDVTASRPSPPASRILHIVGARPQFVKLAPLYHALRDFSSQIIIHTGQHYDAEMSDFFFRDLDIPAPDYNLEIGSGSQGEQTGLMMTELEKVIKQEQPEVVIIYGDTNSTLAGALVTAKLGIKTVHIEAGLRSYNRTMPEEINRIVADHTSDFLFCPTDTAMINAEKEGLLGKAILTGDIMVDSIHEGAQRAKVLSHIINEMELTPLGYNLLTLHRPYNVDNAEKLHHILANLNQLSQQTIFPVHPRTRIIMDNSPLEFHNFLNIRYIKPLGYLDFVMLEQNSIRIITDSGGIQKEAYILKKPCITLRSETEWTETVEQGWNLLLNPDIRDFYQQIESFTVSSVQQPVFGEQVAQRMKSEIKRILG